tara:strand:- start:675 stop:1073 length:399 start_codon:yes stop_codon:yes gene_type:complete
MNPTLRQQLEAFENGIFLDSDGSKDSGCFVFYDWFCRDSSLKNKSIKLFKQVKLFVKMKDVDLDNTYVFFKNNCPVGGSLYDDFRICNYDSGNVIYSVTSKSGHTGEAELWGKDNNFEEPIKTGKTFTDLLV